MGGEGELGNSNISIVYSIRIGEGGGVGEELRYHCVPSHGITIHNQDLMRERESGVISFIIYYYGGGLLRGSWEILKFLLSIL